MFYPQIQTEHGYCEYCASKKSKGAMRTQQTYTKKQPERKGILSLGYRLCVMAPFLRKAASLFLAECANPYLLSHSSYVEKEIPCVLYNIDKLCSHQTLPGDF